MMQTLHEVMPEIGQDEFKRDLKLKLGSMGVSGSAIAQTFAKLTPAQAADIDAYLASEAERIEADAASRGTSPGAGASR